MRKPPSAFLPNPTGENQVLRYLLESGTIGGHAYLYELITQRCFAF
jgi:hypothetical protein